MKGPGIKDYSNYINTLKQRAREEGLDFVDISSKEVHTILSPEHSTLVTCCMAMYKLMFEGDEILQSPNTQTGYGAKLIIRYYVQNLEERKLKFENKKRGRPKMTEEQMRRQKLTSKSKPVEILNELTVHWLKKQEYGVVVGEDMIWASKDNEKWLLKIDKIRRGRPTYLIQKFANIFESISEEPDRISIVMNDSRIYRNEWKGIAPIIKNKLNISLILITQKGTIIELK